MKLRILLADDHEIVRRGLVCASQKHEGWEVCGEASDGREAVEMAKQLKPDVVIVDIGMPYLNGLDTTRQLLQHDPHFKVIVLTITDSDQVIREALDAGRAASCSSPMRRAILVSAVEALQSKRMFFTPRVNDLVLAGFLEKGHAMSRNEPPNLPTLTAREREVTQLLAEGKEFQGSGVAAEFEHQDRGNASQQHHAEIEPAFHPRSGGVCHQEQHHPDPDAAAAPQPPETTVA